MMQGQSARTFSFRSTLPAQLPYSAEKWSAPLEAAAVPRKVISQSSRWMVDHMGTGWTDWAKMGSVNVAAHTEAVTEEHMDWMIYVNCDFLMCFIHALFGDDINTKQTPYMDTLRPIVLTPTNLQLLAGEYDTATWVAQPETQPAVHTWAQFLFRFEGNKNPQAFNLPADFNSAFLISTGSTKQNIRQLDAMCQESGVEIVKLYKDLPTFLSARRMNYLVNMVHNLANLDSADSDSWIAAKAHLQSEHLANGTLCIEQVHQAIAIAEDQNILLQTQDNYCAARATAATANSATKSPDNL